MEYLLRQWRESDAEGIVQYANDITVANYLRDAFPYPYTLADAKRFVANCIAADESKTCLRAIDIGGQAAGSIGAFKKDDVYQKSAEIGYWLGAPFRNRGILTSAVAQLCREIFGRWDIVRIFAEPFAQNAASCRVLEKSGFVLEGVLKNSVYKNGCIQDSCIYALLR
jgi:ribosomal-protein-alanine N-acetyltransferase